ncbi:oxygenase MpaB family protein [[Mycobacterium] kokjensenii]|uniref:Oxygenase MpaB family protein n=1 Tax=[Mycobacterium] kokjensenii TaxID=3064287 RepID=A0ABN9NH37_9MYCO|nr:oxygenase MpaB family protein [Mycolicibacter sp. MU0083]CAJ1506260.1 oxygenase MpaB family protein [Mycolicibacter sp. MU0083]
MATSGVPDCLSGERGDSGFFGPGSVAWRVFTAPATALMIAQVTNLMEVPHIDFQSVLVDHDPLFPTNRKRQRGRGGARKDGYFHDRLRRTLSVPLPILFGDKKSATACADRLMQYHRPMNGPAAAGAPAYSAIDPETMLFGAVTIAHSALIAYERFAFRQGRLPRRLDAADRDRYFAEMSVLATLMGVPAADVPMTAAQVDAYYRSIADKFTRRRGFRGAQVKAAAALIVPSGWRDVPKTVRDVLLIASAAVAAAALPRPSRRLNALPALADPLLAVLYAAWLPVFAVVSLPGVRSLALRWYLGAADTATLTRARRSLGARPDVAFEAVA